MRRGYSLFFSLFLITFRTGFTEGNLVLDARWVCNDQSNLYLFGEELNYKYELPAGSIFLQGLNQTPKGERNDFRLGEAWFTLNFLDNILVIKAGRFPLPFGLNSFYDPHFEVIQPLYQQSLGLRMDEGASISGSYGEYRFTFSATQGTGSSKGEKKTFIFRVEREIPKNPLVKGDFGFSLLAGNLPLVEETGITSKMIDKTRIGLDFQLHQGKSQILGEAHIGGDKDINVGGFFLVYEIPLKKNLKFLLSWRSFNFDLDRGKETRVGSGGISWDINKHNKISFVYQRDHKKKSSYTLQFLTSYSFSDLAKRRF